MRVVSVRELKAKPSEFLRLAAQGKTVVIATPGKPTAVLRAIGEEELEDYILENSPRIKRLVTEGERNRRAGRVTPLEKYVVRLRKQVPWLRGRPHRASGSGRGPSSTPPTTSGRPRHRIAG